MALILHPLSSTKVHTKEPKEGEVHPSRSFALVGDRWNNLIPNKEALDVARESGAADDGGVRGGVGDRRVLSRFNVF